MSFSNQERINAVAKALLGNVLDADPVAQWYESVTSFGFVLDANKVWVDAPILKANPAANLVTAQANCVGPLSGIVADLSLAASAVRLTPLPSVNNTYVALTTYGDFTSALLDNWVKPAFIPQATGQPSVGYATRLYNGDPAGAGVEVLTTAGTTGTGVNKSVGWIWNYDNGLLLMAADFAASVTNPYVTGFRYIGAIPGTGGGMSVVTTLQRIALIPTSSLGDVVYDSDLLSLFAFNGSSWEMV
jgi:hypothetical protein